MSHTEAFFPHTLVLNCAQTNNLKLYAYADPYRKLVKCFQVSFQYIHVGLSTERSDIITNVQAL